MGLNNRQRRHAIMFLVYLGVLLLGCSGSKWSTQPSQPVAAVEQKSNIETIRQEATSARGNATAAIRYATAVSDHLTAGEPASPEADPGLAIELLDVALQQEPLRGAELDFARGKVEFALRDYAVAVATYETNARKRGHADSATEVVRYHAAAGDREALKGFCDGAFPLVRGGDAKNQFITECVAGMGYASPAEWELMSAPAQEEYERWRLTQAQEKNDEKAQKAAAVRAERDHAVAAERAQDDKKKCILRCAEKEALCKTDCYNEQCRRDCSDAEWACRRQCS